jgi:hypothetical protein
MARDVYQDHDEIVETRKDSLGNGLVIVTTLLLLAAIYFMQTALGDHYGKGMFGGEQSAPE